MGPAQAMGTFLRVWRSEWALLSRAQLATAVRGAAPKARGVTEDVVRRWEQGQPPATTEELEALLAAMRRHGLTQPEVKQFRTAVYAACLDRHYPGAFECEDFAERTDVDEAALPMYFVLGHRPWEGNIVQGVACLEALRASLRGHPRPGAPRSQQRRQEAALALLQEAFSSVHAKASRFRLGVDALSAARALVDERLNGRGTCWLTSHRLYADWLHCTGYLAWQQLGDAPTASVRELLELHRHGVAERDSGLQAHAIRNAVDLLPMTHQPDWAIAVRSLEHDQLAAAIDCGDTPTVGLAYWSQARAALELGVWADAERHLKGFDHWQASDNPLHRRWWEIFMANHAAARGDWAEAIEHCEKTIALSERMGAHYFAGCWRWLLQQWHDEQEKANRRKRKPGAPAQPATK